MHAALKRLIPRHSTSQLNLCPPFRRTDVVAKIKQFTRPITLQIELPYTEQLEHLSDMGPPHKFLSRAFPASFSHYVHALISLLCSRTTRRIFRCCGQYKCIAGGKWRDRSGDCNPQRVDTVVTQWVHVPQTRKRAAPHAAAAITAYPDVQPRQHTFSGGGACAPLFVSFVYGQGGV